MEDIKTNVDNENLGVNENEANQEKKETYTQEELDAFLQKETDRRVTAALKKQEDKFNNKRKEAEKLRNMDESQRKEYELSKRLAELEDKEKEFNVMANKIECQKILTQRGLDVSFVEYVVSDSAEKMMENIEMFETQFKAAVADAVSKKVSNKTPGASITTQKGMTAESFKKLSIAEQAELYKTNKALYDKLNQK